jgi:acetyl esterase
VTLPIEANMIRRPVAWAFSGLLIIAGSPAFAQEANLPAEVHAAITEMGPTLNPEVTAKTVKLMAPLQASRAELKVTRDIDYGPDPLQKLDLYSPQASATAAAPVILFVHGGGFRTLDKRNNENVAAYFARHGMLGASMNFRLAPAVTWPAQSLDIGAAVSWLKANAARFGGDPRRIVIVGHSSGGAIVASYLFDHSIETTRDGIVGAVLVSGVYGYHTKAPFYYGEELTTAAQREPRSHLKEQHPPVMVVSAEFDPPGIAADNHALMAALCMEDSRCPPFMLLTGHNHVSEIHSIDTADDRLGGRVLAFVSTFTK